MKKINFSLCFLAGILLCSFVMVACSSDDDDDNDENGGSANSSKRIARIIDLYGKNDMIDKTYTYDAQGRIVLIKEVETYNGKEDPGEVTYQYDKNSIQCHSEDGYSVDDHIYTLIVDNDEEASTSNYDIVWKDGNIASFGDDNLTYSDIVWNKNMIIELQDDLIDPNLLLTGYFGKCPKYMPQTIGYCTYKYTLGPDGLISKISIKGSFNYERSISWE